jgi:hypothetical protein
MRQIAFLLCSAGVVFWYVEPPSRTFAQQKVAAPKAAPVPPQKAAMKAPAVKQEDGPLNQIIEGIGRLLSSAPAVQDPEDPLVQQFKQQFGTQFRQLYKSELHFMRVACQPTKPQFEKIAGDGEPAFNAMLKKFAERWRRPVGDGPSDPRTLLAEALLRSVRSTLSPDQAAQYQMELDQRIAARKRVMALNLVDKIDHLLVLTAEQRVQLVDILQKNWNDSWNQEQWLTYVNHYFPPMPDEKILPVLTEMQKKVWRDTPKGNIHFGYYPQFLQGIELEEEVWDDERPQKSPERADGQAAAKGKDFSKPAGKK